MIEFLNWAGDHPFLAVFFTLFVCGVIRLPFSLGHRALRSRNIKHAGWPPPHLDADGGWKDDDD